MRSFTTSLSDFPLLRSSHLRSRPSTCLRSSTLAERRRPFSIRVVGSRGTYDDDVRSFALSEQRRENGVSNFHERRRWTAAGKKRNGALKPGNSFPLHRAISFYMPPPTPPRERERERERGRGEKFLYRPRQLHDGTPHGAGGKRDTSAWGTCGLFRRRPLLTHATHCLSGCVRGI